jgi:hypothetical protein
MNCADFEHGVTRLLGNEVDDERRSAELDTLRRHAADCTQCRATDDLLDLLALPPGERDLVDEPPESYWSELQTNVRRRMGERVAEPGWRRSAWTAVAAAAVLAVVAGLWFVLGLPADQDGARDDGPAARNGLAAGELPPALDELLQRAGPDEALAGLDFLAGFPGMAESAAADGAVDAGWVVPEIENLDAEARGALLLWLEEGASRKRGVES